MTTDFTLVTLIGIFIIGAVLRNYYLLWFLAGVTCWGLGVWWIYNPLIAGSSPMNDIALTVAFVGGTALMFMMLWRTRNINGSEVGGFNIRLPEFLGGQSEEDEIAESRRRNRNVRTRREYHQERLNAASRGRRISR